jgi:hypothetical protein
MPTFDSMAEEVMGYLKAFSAEQERKTYLTSPLTATSVTFTVEHSDRIAEGLAEVDEELIEVSEVDGLSNTVTLFPWGRGQQGSTATVHSIEARVVASPRWPRVWVKRAINEVITSTWPDLFAVRLDEANTTNVNVIAYPLPAGAKRVLDVRYKPPGSPEYWQGIGNWRLDLSPNATDFPTGVALDIGSAMWPGCPLKVTYAAEPAQLVAGSDDFASVTGLQDTAADLVVIGAAARLVVSAELARTQSFTVAHAQMSQQQPAGAASAASRYLQQEYQVRLKAERDRLFDRYPIRVRRTWR